MDNPTITADDCNTKTPAEIVQLVERKLDYLRKAEPDATHRQELVDCLARLDADQVERQAQISIMEQWLAANKGA